MGGASGQPPRKFQCARRYRSLNAALGLGKRHNNASKSSYNVVNACVTSPSLPPHSLPLLHTTAPSPPPGSFLQQEALRRCAHFQILL